MTTTRISHTGHNHPSTTAARTACRKAMKATVTSGPVVMIATVGKGIATHYVDMATATTRCGKAQPVHQGEGPLVDVTCKGCRSRYGVAHN